ncbi:MAG TPA: hypothetical protein VEV44_19605 [Pseudoneobacillus sp.]|nr:hypothetical protein [Pseudoneobacillus sp.]
MGVIQNGIIHAYYHKCISNQGDPPKTIQPIAEKIRKETGAEFAVIGDKDGIRLSHPLKSKIGEKNEGRR